MPGRLRFTDLESGDGLGGGAGHFGEELVAVVDAEGGVGGFDGEGGPGVGDADVDALTGDAKPFTVADPLRRPFYLPHWGPFPMSAEDWDALTDPNRES